ncbi:hypothetical protein ACK8P5_12190 [Paenibacillus sp. EC2-1]|uniref:hypothetical protein n=1 Tax=Paenibacillus sp. EC2-1 TaxID=3388665 RepID=UPI003BEF47DF
MLFIACVVGGLLWYQSSLAMDTDDQIPETPLNYLVDENGKTYGVVHEDISEDSLPDYIYAGNINNISGYVLKSDYLGEFSRNVPVYDVDGVNIIGSIHYGAKNMIFPKNNNGQTYGSSADASSPEMEPELISAVGIDGTKGYVLKKDLDGERPKSPEEAIAIQNSRPPGGVDIPLYDVDGETVIGVFQMGGK